MLHEVSELRVEPGHRLWVRFADGVEGVVDLLSLVGRGAFALLADEAAFAGATIDEFGAVCWPNGADLAPDAMHAALKRHGRWQPALTGTAQPA
jgi:Protein of unknown function (DUF2442)